MLPEKDAEIIERELQYIENWLDKHAPEDVKFSLQDKVDANQFSDQQKDFMRQLADKIEQAPSDADGGWFHLAIYELKDSNRYVTKRFIHHSLPGNYR
jgi:lysyl-tRNA synthetase class 1